MAELKLTAVTRTQGNNRALNDGSVKPKTFAFEFVEVDPLIDAFRRMVRGLEFDICEMAITTYICARAHGKRMTATLQVPGVDEARYFADHFPRRPVFPSPSSTASMPVPSRCSRRRKRLSR